MRQSASLSLPLPTRSSHVRPQSCAVVVSLVVHAAFLAHCAVQYVMKTAEPAPIRVTIRNGGGSPQAATQAAATAPAAPAPAAAAAAMVAAVQPQTIVKPPKPSRPAPKVARAAAPAAAPLVASAPASAAGTTTAVGDNTGDGTGSGVAANGSGGGVGNGRGHGTGSGSGSGSSSMAAYLATVRSRIEHAKRYPSMARRRGLEGRAAIAFEITARGEPLHLKISFADHPLLAEAARQAVNNAAPFPAFPAEISIAAMQIEVPLRFTLENDSEEEE